MRNFRFTSRLKWLLFAVCFTAATYAHSAEDGLYDAPVPDDAVFVRWLGPQTSSYVLGYQFPDSHIGVSYVAISARYLTDVTVGTFYSVVSGPEGAPIVIAEPARANRSKVSLYLINMRSSYVRVMVAGTATQVIAPTAPQNVAMRPVNPVRVNLSVEPVAQSDVLAAFDVSLRRGQNLTFFIQNNRIDLIENQFGPVLRPAE